MGKAQSLPAFLLSVFVFYWSLPLMVMTYAPFMSARMKGRRKDTYVWSCFMKAFFQVKVLKHGTHQLYKPKEGNILYLCNHRSWADFFVDVYLTQGAAALMSRWLVFFVFPIFMTSVRILRGIVLFKRGTIADKKAFNTWLDLQLSGSPELPCAGLLVYPEGHRSTKPTSLPLKRGMLHYAHSRGMPVQIIITKGKEAVMSEKHMSVSWGSTVVTSFSQVIESKDTDFEGFAATIQSTWDKLWADVYAADVKGLPALVQENVPEFDYTQEMRTQQAAIAYGSALALVLVLLASFKVLLLVTGIAGVLIQKVLLSALAGWLLWSVVTAQAVGVKAASK